MSTISEKQPLTAAFRRSQLRMSFPPKPFNYAYLFLALTITLLMYHLLNDLYPAKLESVQQLLSSSSSISSSSSDPNSANNAPPPYLHFTAPAPGRDADISDVFSNMRHQDMCKVSSLDLHVPFEPLCPSRSALLRAMSWGGRPGVNAPYIPYGCDMRFYTPEEMCSILSRYSKVILIGDSIIRHVTNAMWILMRGDMGYGALRRWDMSKKTNDTTECACHGQYNNRECNMVGFRQSDWRSKEAEEEDEQHVCGSGAFPLEMTYQPMLDYPIDPAHTKAIMSMLPQDSKPSKPIAFILGHGLWNDMDSNKTSYWLDQLQESVDQREYAAQIPKLFLSTNAGGEGKPVRFLKTQSNNRMRVFEHEIEPVVEERGIEFLGLFNMSVQSTTIDGTHANLEVNLLKAMMVLNWLDKFDTSSWSSSSTESDQQALSR